MVKTVFESEASLRNYCEKMEEIRVDACMSACVGMCQPASAHVRWNVYSRGGFYASQKWFVCTQTTSLWRFICTVVTKKSVRILTGFLCVQSAESAPARVGTCI